MNWKDVRNAVLCSLVVLGAIFLTNPFVEISFNDDWVYAFTVRDLLHTGSLHYFGEAAPVLIQTWWGALLAKVFGFSLVLMRFSTLPWALGSVVLTYLLARRAKLDSSRAVFAAIALGLSPLFLPLATSFMTDVPSLFFILLSIYFFVLAAERYRLVVLILAFAAGFIGGTQRQIVWLVPMILGPYVAYITRKNKRALVVSLAGVAAVFAGVVFCSKWFYSQPLAVSEWSFSQTVQMGLQTWTYSLVIWFCIWLTMLMLVLPAALPMAWASLVKTCNNLRNRRGALAAVIAIAIALGSLYWPAIAIEPWLGDIVSPRGPLSGMELSGYRPVSQPPLLREMVALAVIVVAWALLTDLLDNLIQPRLRRRLNLFLRPTGRQIVITSMLLFAIVYLLLLGYRVPRGFAYDRYCLPLLPCVTIPMLSAIPARGRSKRIVNSAAWTILIVWSLYALAATQDVHALQAARRSAMDRVLSSGASDTSILDGSEFDNWTQLLHQGYLNISFMTPPGQYDPALGICPSLRPLYRVEFRPTADTVPSDLGSIDFISWLPPFHRRIYIDRFRDPYWLNSNNTIAPPNDFEDFHLH